MLLFVANSEVAAMPVGFAFLFLKSHRAFFKVLFGFFMVAFSTEYRISLRRLGTFSRPMEFSRRRPAAFHFNSSVRRPGNVRHRHVRFGVFRWNES